MEVKFEVQMTKSAMFDFLLYSSYTSLTGILNVIVGIVTLGIGVNKIVQGDISDSMIFFMLATVFLVGIPINIKFRASEQVLRTPMFQKPLCYELTEEGVQVSQDDQSASNKWEDFRKVIETKKSVIMYITQKRAIIFPKECLCEQYDAAVKMISAHMPAKKVKLHGKTV